MSAKRVRPTRPPIRWLLRALVTGLVLTGFVTLMIRLEVTQEGYQLSHIRMEVADLHVSNRQLRLEAAELGSHRRLRGVAAKLGLGPPARGQVVVVP